MKPVVEIYGKNIQGYLTTLLVCFLIRQVLLFTGFVGYKGCEEQAAASGNCYLTEGRRFSAAIDASSGRPEQYTASCNYIRNLVDKCDKLLCHPPDRLSSIYENEQYVKVIFADFDVRKCHGLIPGQ